MTDGVPSTELVAWWMKNHTSFPLRDAHLVERLFRQHQEKEQTKVEDSK